MPCYCLHRTKLLDIKSQRFHTSKGFRGALKIKVIKLNSLGSWSYFGEKQGKGFYVDEEEKIKIFESLEPWPGIPRKSISY